jgi:hypothetical protein
VWPPSGDHATRQAVNLGVPRVRPGNSAAEPPSSSATGHELELQAVELRRQLGDRDNELDAARAANRDLVARINKPP